MKNKSYMVYAPIIVGIIIVLYDIFRVHMYSFMQLLMAFFAGFIITFVSIITAIFVLKYMFKYDDYDDSVIYFPLIAAAVSVILRVVYSYYLFTLIQYNPQDYTIAMLQVSALQFMEVFVVLMILQYCKKYCD